MVPLHFRARLLAWSLRTWTRTGTCACDPHIHIRSTRSMGDWHIYTAVYNHKRSEIFVDGCARCAPLHAHELSAYHVGHGHASTSHLPWRGMRALNMGAMLRHSHASVCDTRRLRRLRQDDRRQRSRWIVSWLRPQWGAPSVLCAKCQVLR